MKNSFLLACLFFLASQAFAQFGVIGGYKTFNATKWNALGDEVGGDPFPISGYHAGLDYWFRVKKRRIEFSPELSFSSFKKEVGISTLKHQQLSFFFNTSFYLLDFKSDCNCPTFSKDGNTLSKGFFLELAPGVSFINHDWQVENSNGSLIKIADNSLSVGGSIGAGLDIGFTDVFTLTPLARFYFSPKTSLEDGLKAEFEDSELQQVFAGLRLRVHFNEINKYGYR